MSFNNVEIKDVEIKNINGQLIKVSTNSLNIDVDAISASTNLVNSNTVYQLSERLNSISSFTSNQIQKQIENASALISENIKSITGSLYDSIKNVSGLLQKVSGTIDSINPEITTNIYYNYNLPVGSIIAFAGSSCPPGFLICSGSILLSSDYPDLYDVLGNKEEDTQQFTIPDLTDRFIQGYGPQGFFDINTQVPAGLPNIIGEGGIGWVSNFIKKKNNIFSVDTKGQVYGAFDILRW